MTRPADSLIAPARRPAGNPSEGRAPGRRRSPAILASAGLLLAAVAIVGSLFHSLGAVACLLSGFALAALPLGWADRSAARKPAPSTSAPVPPSVPPEPAAVPANVVSQSRQSQRMEAVGRLAGGVAHDFNNLLTVINGFSDMLAAALPPGGPEAEMVGEIRKAGERASGLTRQLLAFSRKQVLQPRLVDLNALVRDLEKMLRRLVREDVLLEVATQPAPLPVLVDPGQLEQVLMNLVVNARDAMPRGGRLSVQTGTADYGDLPLDSASAPAAVPHAVLTVADTGCGMDEATQARIFEPFFTTKAQGQGTGLGLATVHGIVRQSRGLIAVDSAPGAGTTFQIYLPLARQPAPAADAPASPPRPAPHGRETILLVEDEAAVRALAQRTLESHGYTVLAASHGADALAVVEQHTGPLDLVLTDVVMPHLGGPALVGQLARRYPGLRVIYMSGYTDSVLVHQGVSDRMVDYIDKPFTAESLTALVREVLDHAAPTPTVAGREHRHPGPRQASCLPA